MKQEIISRDLLDVLVCPQCRSDLTLVQAGPLGPGLKCPACKCLYPIVDGIPVMIREEALGCD